MRVLIAAFLLLAGVAQPAAAATTVYATTVFGTTGTVTTPGAALGPGDGASATILRVPGGSSITLQLSKPATGLNIVVAGQRLTAASNVQITIGEIIGGVAIFATTNFNFPGGLGSIHNFDLSAACAGVSATGCSLLRIRVTSPPGGGFLLDGVSGVSAAPEASMWAMMLIGFGAVAWRLKKHRGSRAHFARINVQSLQLLANGQASFKGS